MPWRYASLTHGLTIWTNMPTIMGTYPAGFINRLFQCTLKPGPAIADAPSGTLTIARGPAKLQRAHGLGIADIAKYKFSYAHNTVGVRPKKLKTLWCKINFTITIYRTCSIVYTLSLKMAAALDSYLKIVR